MFKHLTNPENNDNHDKTHKTPYSTPSNIDRLLKNDKDKENL